MAAGPDALLQYIHRLCVRPEPDEATDAALLRRFISEGDERAFTALVDRHGPLVLQVCRRVLGDGGDAEDAFQATFLVLARKAATLRHREALSAWLHGVARRVALKARSARARQFHRRTEFIPSCKPLPVVDPRPDPLAEFSGRELVMIIDQEVQRLPEAYRLPVLLCCLEGRSLEEAARQLGWTPGSVKGRLERGRARLHDRLLRRGLTLSAALAAAEVSQGAAPAAVVVARLAAATARGALLFAVRPQAATGEASAAAVALAGQTLKGMAVARLKVAAALVLVIVLLTTGWVMLRAGPEPDPDQPAQARSAPLADGPPGELPRDPDAPIDVGGCVLDPQDRPIAGARLYVGFSAPRSAPEVRFQPLAYRLRATSGTDGQFRFTFTQSELDAVWPCERLSCRVPSVDPAAAKSGLHVIF